MSHTQDLQPTAGQTHRHQVFIFNWRTRNLLHLGSDLLENFIDAHVRLLVEPRQIVLVLGGHFVVMISQRFRHCD